MIIFERRWLTPSLLAQNNEMTIEQIQISRIDAISGFHPEYPPSNLVAKTSFWTSTGMYPQELVVTLANIQAVGKIVFSTRNIKSIQLFHKTANGWENFGDVLDIEQDGGILQALSISSEGFVQTRQIKILVSSGFDAFCSIHSISIY